MTQLSLLTVPPPALPEGIDLRCCSVEELLADVAGAEDRPGLIVADPPWSYSQAPGVAHPELQYRTIGDASIAQILASSWDSAGPDSRLALWTTWPKLGEWTEAAAELGPRWRWQYVTGGSWHKTGSGGVGYHWLGASEPVLVYKKGSPYLEWGPLENAWTGPRERHSEKPWAWMAGWIERWTEPGDLVLELYAGMAPVARACLATGRRYLGAELDPERHRQALDRLALFDTNGETHD